MKKSIFFVAIIAVLSLAVAAMAASPVVKVRVVNVDVLGEDAVSSDEGLVKTATMSIAENAKVFPSIEIDGAEGRQGPGQVHAGRDAAGRRAELFRQHSARRSCWSSSPSPTRMGPASLTARWFPATGRSPTSTIRSSSTTSCGPSPPPDRWRWATGTSCCSSRRTQRRSRSGMKAEWWLTTTLPTTPPTGRIRPTEEKADGRTLGSPHRILPLTGQVITPPLHGEGEFFYKSGRHQESASFRAGRSAGRLRAPYTSPCPRYRRPPSRSAGSPGPSRSPR